MAQIEMLLGKSSYLFFFTSNFILVFKLFYTCSILFKVKILIISTGELDKVRKVIMKIKQLITKVNIEIAQ